MALLCQGGNPKARKNSNIISQKYLHDALLWYHSFFTKEAPSVIE